MQEARPLYSVPGTCSICEHEVQFNAWSDHLRDTFLCGRCASIPRERAIMVAIEKFAPNWRELRIHESSPAPRGVSLKLAEECSRYTATQYHPSVPEGSHHSDGWRCENLERQTFGDGEFDLVITQDVLEHVFDFDAVCREIARTLAPGGMHIATTPLVMQQMPSVPRATIGKGGSITYLGEAEYHGNPVDGDGALVTFWWGFDIANRIDRVAPFNTIISSVRDPSSGIDGPLNEVLISIKT